MEKKQENSQYNPAVREMRIQGKQLVPKEFGVIARTGWLTKLKQG